MGSSSAHAGIVVVGGGIAGMTAAALLAKTGAAVTVLERHTVAGGCASFYQRRRYRFDVGATLVGGFGPRGVHTRIFDLLGVAMEHVAVEPAMVVHLPDGAIARYGDARWRGERLRAFGPEAEPFWKAQERLADAAWEFAAHLPALPVDWPSLRAGLSGFGPRQLRLAGALGKRVADILGPRPSRRLRTFVDAQLLITAQATAEEADLAYGATALDLAREGTFHLPGGTSAIATGLARAARRYGARVRYGAEAAAIEADAGRVRGVRLTQGEVIPAGRVVSSLPLFDLLRLCPQLQTRALGRRAAAFPQRWGAFTLYCGLPAGVVPDGLPLHHQIVLSYERPLGEGNSIFVSISPQGEAGRAPGGGRAVTISTHTDVALWERAAASGDVCALREEYTLRLAEGLDLVLPWASTRAEVLEAGTPLTFERYTGRFRGLVGGLPQTTGLANLRAPSHRTGIGGLYACGDTFFPGQSSVGATLSGIAAARAAGAGV